MDEWSKCCLGDMAISECGLAGRSNFRRPPPTFFAALSIRSNFYHHRIDTFTAKMGKRKQVKDGDVEMGGTNPPVEGDESDEV